MNKLISNNNNLTEIVSHFRHLLNTSLHSGSITTIHQRTGTHPKNQNLIILSHLKNYTTKKHSNGNPIRRSMIRKRKQLSFLSPSHVRFVHIKNAQILAQWISMLKKQNMKRDWWMFIAQQSKRKNGRRIFQAVQVRYIQFHCPLVLEVCNSRSAGNLWKETATTPPEFLPLRRTKTRKNKTKRKNLFLSSFSPVLCNLLFLKSIYFVALRSPLSSSLHSCFSLYDIVIKT